MVKRAGPGVVDDASYYSDSQPSVVGRKRSVRDRLGSNADSSTQFNNKRFASLFICMLITYLFLFILR